MGPKTGGRFVGLAAVVVAALLGSAYALGQSMVPGPHPRSTGVSANADDPHSTDQPPEASPGRDRAPTPSPAVPTARPTEGSQDGATRKPSKTADDGLFGARVDTGSAEVALTFDDGPDPQYTPQVLALLRAYGVKATFCVVGENAQNHPDLIQAIVADGHTLCNHSWQHDVLLGKRSPSVIRADLLRTNAAIRDAVPDAPIGYFRQPGGAWTYPVVSAAEELGMTPMHWTVDPSDWRAPGAAKIASAVLAGVQPGAVVLLHDAGGDRQGTVDALHDILPDLTGRFRLEALRTGTT
ncbi:Peptidoglycan-N-acetylglucosamine deacetylase [Micromonospora sp. MW-13]|uniref:polysaccharide deacetylase family protein n=1 Tax=unclassified Micromonospora TaxID=2617518 RepID=UPI000E42E5B2|nr:MULTISPECIES: polysaccharide deacetylase family protein [unclassified Micromonospora]MCX4469782.1 polysaccharide deacetylase family protein [Micromonospora sp. NBC_01655]RGC71078.1 Peptidoglycan-N-acetylglucosamine deacetylase [Micromonospora sp. MW-13]